MVIATIIFMDACKGEKGDIGPAGSTGATGAIGTTGPAGTNTGSNITQVNFTKTFVPPSYPGDPQVFTFPTVVTTTMLEKSALICFFEPAEFPGQWYSTPGPGVVSNPDGSLLPDFIRYWIDTASRQISIIRDSGKSISAITGIKVFIIPANSIINGRKANIDFSNYEAVKAYYNLPN